VISEHRSEVEARENASLERARLEVIYGDAARSWRILVTRDDEIVAEEIPHGGDEPRRRAAERAPRSLPEPEIAPAPPPEAPADPSRSPGPEEAEAGDPPGAPAERPRERAEGEGSGPIPDWLITRVEESIARQRDRTYGPAGDEDERGGGPRR
jgi:hypothetical protein